MAKSIRSKRMKRLRSLKRAHYMAVQGNEKLAQVSALQRRTNPDREFAYQKPPNKFLYPSHPDAQVPRHQDRKIIDFRSESVPLSGLTAVGVMRDPQKIRKGVGATMVTEEEKLANQSTESQQIQNVDELADMMGGMGLQEREKRWERRENKKYFGEERRVEKKVEKRKTRCEKSKKIQTNFKKRQFK